MSKFYTFHQNNSGGHFVIDKDKGLTEVVIIEAHDYNHANSLAKDYGIYFDGVRKGYDCECCGDRWNDVWDEDDGYDFPSVYGKDCSEYDSFVKESPICIHYLNGTKEWK